MALCWVDVQAEVRTRDATAEIGCGALLAIACCEATFQPMRHTVTETGSVVAAVVIVVVALPTCTSSLFTLIARCAIR
ncbi:hypothetical protein K431DRAFT_283726 [Polychaeton citri CBS 116435]|uniref:Uncharacterized protein n=1 Tax=Polychaeton citri CBS 116435 TaxID=1314669 RepID=A0A9P4QA33_9PEZI|nr:hypothetical protein K431DRAFT_283726 [Polychaeton citri CBS 116435]